MTTDDKRADLPDSLTLAYTDHFGFVVIAKTDSKRHQAHGRIVQEYVLASLCAEERKRANALERLVKEYKDDCEAKIAKAVQDEMVRCMLIAEEQKRWAVANTWEEADVLVSLEHYVSGEVWKRLSAKFHAAAKAAKETK